MDDESATAELTDTKGQVVFDYFAILLKRLLFMIFQLAKPGRGLR